MKLIFGWALFFVVSVVGGIAGLCTALNYATGGWSSGLTITSICLLALGFFPALIMASPFKTQVSVAYRRFVTTIGLALITIFLIVATFSHINDSLIGFVAMFAVVIGSVLYWTSRAINAIHSVGAPPPISDQNPG